MLLDHSSKTTDLLARQLIHLHDNTQSLQVVATKEHLPPHIMYEQGRDAAGSARTTRPEAGVRPGQVRAGPRGKEAPPRNLGLAIVRRQTPALALSLMGNTRAPPRPRGRRSRDLSHPLLPNWREHRKDNST